MGVITWTNHATHVTCRVEWASDLNGSWRNSWTSLNAIASGPNTAMSAYPGRSELGHRLSGHPVPGSLSSGMGTASVPGASAITRRQNGLLSRGAPVPRGWLQPHATGAACREGKPLRPYDAKDALNRRCALPCRLQTARRIKVGNRAEAYHSSMGSAISGVWSRSESTRRAPSGPAPDTWMTARTQAAFSGAVASTENSCQVSPG